METNEHKDAGDKIRIETLDNPYFKSSKGLSTAPGNNLYLKMMYRLDGVPMPLDLELSAGDVVALAGDYYTKEGWGLELFTPVKCVNGTEENEQVAQKQVDSHEAQAFRQAYDDLASPAVTKKAINRIFAIDGARFIPSLLKQLIYAFTVPGYGKKLTNNEAHFSPWSLRAYIVGHDSALRMAEIAHYCHAIAAGRVSKEDKNIPADIRIYLDKILKQISTEPKKYQLDGKTDQQILTELGHRYHAMAVARDLFAMHFYSDHFAGGHGRLGRMRLLLPQQFGVWGSILVNTMHNEDNKKGVWVTNSFQDQDVEKDQFKMIKNDSVAYGDGTYFNHGNSENRNMLINGMDNSLGDIARLMVTGTRPQSSGYGGLTFLPEMDFCKRQTQPLLMHGLDNKIYFRSDLNHIKMLSPEEYENTVKEPLKHGYEELTPWKSFMLVVKLWVFAPFYSSKVEATTAPKDKEISENETVYASRRKQQKESVKQFFPPIKSMEDNIGGQWRHNSSSFSLAQMDFLGNKSTKSGTVHNAEEERSNLVDSTLV